MNGRIDSGLGQIVIDTDVIATYAGSVAVECFGIVGMAAVSMKDGLVKLLRKDSLKHGISVTITEDNRIRLNFHVIVAYGVNISTIADNLVSNVKYKVEDFTGMEIEKINIYVEGRSRHRLIIRGGTCGEHKDHRCQSTFQNVSGRCQEPGSKKRMDQ